MITIFACFVAIVLAVALLRLAIIDRAAIARRRELADNVANQLSAKGLTVLPTLLRDYSQGNLVKLMYDLDHSLKTLLDPVAASAEFDTLFTQMLQIKIKDPTKSSALIQQIVQLASAAGVKIPTVATVATA